MKLYHRVPLDITGDTLMPLNRLKNFNRALYESYSEKYSEREVLKSVNIPYLDCLWNDVIHLSPVHPSKIVSALIDVGFNELRKIEWFEVCSERNGFTNENTVIYLYKTPFVPQANKSEFVPFEKNQFAQLEELNPEAIEQYRISKMQGKRPLLFHLVPHVLHKGELSLDAMDTILA